MICREPSAAQHDVPCGEPCNPISLLLTERPCPSALLYRSSVRGPQIRIQLLDAIMDR